MSEPTPGQLACYLVRRRENAGDPMSIRFDIRDQDRIIAALRRAEKLETVVYAAKCLGVLPEGYCFCFRNTQAEGYVHTGECRELCTALAELDAIDNAAQP